MSIFKAYKRRCAHCSGFHGYGNCPYYDQRWENRPDIYWEGEEDFNLWNPPYHQYYGEYEHQPLEQEEPYQGSGDRESLRESLEGYLARSEEKNQAQEAILRYQEAEIYNKRAQIKRLESREEAFEEMIESFLVREEAQHQRPSEQLMEGCQILIPSEEAISLEERVVECEELKEVSIVDFVFGDKLMIDEEKPPSIRIHLMNLWSTGIQGKKQAGEWNNFGSTWNRISEKFLNPLILYLIKLALMSDRCCNTMMELCQNLHDLKGLKNFAIDTG